MSGPKSFIVRRNSNLMFSCWFKMPVLVLLLLLVSLDVVVVSANGEEAQSQTCTNPEDCGFDLSTYQFEQPDATKAKFASDGSYFPSNSFLGVPLINIRQETHNSKVLTFGLPSGVGLGIPISSAILMQVPATTAEGKKGVVRPYNPIHFDRNSGSFDLLIKTYPEGLAGDYVRQLSVGDTVSFKQTKTNIKKQFQMPFEGVDKITMVAGGTGIAPMYQALVPILQVLPHIQIKLLYSSKTPQDIMLKQELDDLATKYPSEQFSLHYVVGNSATDNTHGDYLTGWIDKAKIQELGFPPSSSSSVVWVCGVDEMYNDLAGSRMKSLTEDSALYQLGYRDDTVWRS